MGMLMATVNPRSDPVGNTRDRFLRDLGMFDWSFAVATLRWSEICKAEAKLTRQLANIQRENQLGDMV